MTTKSDPQKSGCQVVRAPRVLLVEDDRVQRTLQQRVLTAAGYMVESAEDGAHAIGRLQEAAYDLVITDLLMPHVNGLDLLRWIAVRESAPPVIVLTSRTTPEVLQSATEAGATQVLKKPLRSRLLLDAVAAVLDGA